MTKRECYINLLVFIRYKIFDGQIDWQITLNDVFHTDMQTTKGASPLSSSFSRRPEVDDPEAAISSWQHVTWWYSWILWKLAHAVNSDGVYLDNLDPNAIPLKQIAYIERSIVCQGDDESRSIGVLPRHSIDRWVRIYVSTSTVIIDKPYSYGSDSNIFVSGIWYTSVNLTILQDGWRSCDIARSSARTYCIFLSVSSSAWPSRSACEPDTRTL